jgi:Leucine-rich repeat (LRR) protein
LPESLSLVVEKTPIRELYIIKRKEKNVRLLISLILSILFVTTAAAQESPMEEARARIEAVRASGATSLDLVRLGLSDVPTEIATLEHLESLNISSNPLREFPLVLTELHNLKTLYIIAAQLETVPPEIGKMVSLEVLDLGSNHLISLPDEIASLSNLHYLSIANNDFSRLPPILGEMEQLRTLNFYDNPLNLPNEVRYAGWREVLDYTADPEWWYIKRYLKFGSAIGGVILLAGLAYMISRKRPEKAK